MPFWWWSGDRLDPRRLRWQLDQLRPAGLAGLQVNYSHAVGGGHSFGLTDSSEPRLLTPAWMRIWRGVARDCKRRGLGLGLSDYTLSWPDQGTWTGSTLPPAARAAQVLRLIEVAAEGGQRLDLALPADVVAVTALPQGSQDPAQLRDLAMDVADGRLRWRVAAGRWRILIVHVALDRIRIDACHPGSGQAMLDGVHRPCAEAAGGAGNFFFQDEFFQPKEPVWHRSLLPAIAEARLLPALLTDLGDHGTALRLRWAEATARRMQRLLLRTDRTLACQPRTALRLRPTQPRR